MSQASATCRSRCCGDDRVSQKIVVDFGLCESNGVCMGIIPEVFDLDDQDYLHVLTDDVTPDNEQLVRESVRQCPRQAIAIVDQ